MHAITHPDTGKERFQRKLADSRYFAFSLVLHLVLVILLGGIVLYRAMDDKPDFVADGDGLIATPDSLPAAAESPADAVPAESFAPENPQINSPSIDIISTTATTNTFKVAPAAVKINLKTDAAELAKATGNIAKGIGTGIGGLPGTMGGRSGSGRAAAMQKNKMKPASELAVLRGLEWLRLNQNADGSWGDAHTSAMTGFALLCFLGHGETPESEQYGVTVSKAVEWILSRGTTNQGRLTTDGSIGQPGSYEQGISTYALGEYFTMTKDERVVELLKQALTHIVQGQGPDGGWMYSYDKSPGDLSVTGWQIQALKAGHLTGLKIAGVDAALDKAMLYLEKVKGPNGGYGYRGPEDRYSLSGVGVLSTLFWKGERGKLTRGMGWIIDSTEKQFPIKYKAGHADLYAWYYHTQAALMFGGSAWDKWNRWFQDEITGAQNPDGSWPPPGNPGHVAAGKSGEVYRTTLCILMLEVFYRYMPTNAAL